MNNHGKNVGPIEEAHPFAVSLGWIALLVTIAMLILGIYFERHLSSANDAIVKNTTANTRLNARIQEDAWVRCVSSSKSRVITIGNAEAEKTLFDYVTSLTVQGLKAAEISQNETALSQAARNNAKSRVIAEINLLKKLPHIIIPKPIKPCGVNPHPGLLPLKKITKVKKGGDG